MATGRVGDGGYNPRPRPRSHLRPPSPPRSPSRGKNFPPSPSPTGNNPRRIFTGDFYPSMIQKILTYIEGLSFPGSIENFNSLHTGCLAQIRYIPRHFNFKVQIPQGPKFSLKSTSNPPSYGGP
uniref:Uncharacterized protein n=2 Tax=Opuntia streptacantha TaxID=393608 RepID=A0A7C9E1M9_OPUST